MGYKTGKTSPEALEESENSIIREEINLQFHWYLFTFFISYFVSFLFTGLILYTYIRFFFIPYFLRRGDFLSIIADLFSLLALVLMPFIIIVSYLVHVLLISLFTRLFWRITEKISPSKDGIIPRNLNSKTLNFYNIRSFLIKYPKNAVVKGPFPFLINWLYNFIGTNKVGKGTTIEEQFGADRYVEIGDNCYIGVNSGFSSHSVAGIFGNISYFKIRLGDNVTASALNCLAPGVEIKNNAYLLPMAGATKHTSLKGNNNFYFGAPLRKIFKKKIMDYLDISENDLGMNEILSEKHQKIKNELDKLG
jgi:hypothetical protein